MKLQPFKLERYFAQYEFNVKYLLGASDCESFSISEILEWEKNATEQFHKLHLGYTESLGHPKLRTEIAKLYQNINAQQIIVHSGAEEAIFLFMHALLKPKDHVIIHAPCYQSLIEIPREIGCSISKWQASEKNKWALNHEKLKELTNKNTKAIILNLPHNPTGYLMEKKQYMQLIEYCRKYGIYLFLDEVYRYSEYNPKIRLPAAADIYEKAVSLGVMSKTFGLPGLRIGWIATQNKKIYQKIEQLKDYTTICNSAPAEFLATVALKNKNKIIKRNLNIIQNNVDILDRFFKKKPHTLLMGETKGRTYRMPKI